MVPTPYGAYRASDVPGAWVVGQSRARSQAGMYEVQRYKDIEGIADASTNSTAVGS